MDTQLPKFQPGERFGLRGDDGTLVLDQRAADFLNQVVANAKKLRNVSAAAPLALTSDPGGQTLSISRPLVLWGRLFGASNPYSFHQQVFVPGTGFIDDPTGLSGTNAYEANSVGSLNNKIVRLTYEPTSNDFRFQWIRCCIHTSCFITEQICLPVSEIDGVVATFTRTDGRGDTYVSSTSTGQVTSVTMTGFGSGYDPTNPPTVGFSGGGGSGAVGVPIFGGGQISATIPVTAGGSGYRLPVVHFEGGSIGSGATARALGEVSGFEPLNVDRTGYTNGTGYALSFSGGSPTSTATGTFDVVGGKVTNLQITDPGANYRSAPTVGFLSAGGGTSPFTVAILTLTSISQLTTGGLYVSPTVVITDNVGFGHGATATATAGTIAIGGVSITDGGSGYTSAPSVSFTGGPGSGASGTAVVHKALCITAPDGVYDVDVEESGYVTLPATGVTLPAGHPSGGAFTLLPTGAWIFHNFFIKDSVTGLPISGATVLYENANFSGTCTTDATGKCDLTLSFDEDSGYNLTLTTSAAGYHTSILTGALNPTFLPCTNLPGQEVHLVPI